MARVLFFGRLRDVAGGTERSLSEAITLSAYRETLAQSEPALAAALHAKGVRVALNQQMLAPDADPLLKAGDEVAFMPAFSGG